MRKLKVVSVLNWRQEKGFKRMSNRNFYYSGEERLGGRMGLPNLCAGEEGRRSESALSSTGKWDTGLSTEGFLVIEKNIQGVFSIRTE